MTRLTRLVDFAQTVAADIRSLRARVTAVEEPASSALKIQRASVFIQTQRIVAQQILKAGL
jgi:hypothetical protein